MRFKFAKIFFFLFLLVLLFTACNGECRHRKMSETVVLPSCGERGYTVFTCNDCSFSFESDFVAPSPHTLVASVVAPTCTSAGYTLNECSSCDYNYISDSTPIVAHTINSTIIAPTCTSPGHTLSECSLCDYKTTSDPTSPIPHNIKETKISATCEQEGYTTFSCTTCDFSYTVDRISALAHVFSATVTPPSCLEQGFTTKTCSVCQKSIITDYTAPKGHTYSKKVFRATSSRDGYTLNNCLSCDYSYKSDFEYSYAIFTGAYANTNTPIAKGIDVSSYNETLNWNTLADSGVDFAIIRAGSTKSGKDLLFEVNYNKARAQSCQPVLEQLGFRDSIIKHLQLALFSVGVNAPKLKFSHPIVLLCITVAVYLL